MAGNKGIVSSIFYTFNAAAKTITFSNDYAGLDLGEITYITNIKNGVATVIYDPFDATKGGTLSGLTLTLAYDTTSMSNSDPLQVIVGFTPQNADPLPVRIVANEHDEDQTDLLQTISDNIDLLSRTVDRAEGIEVNVRDINPARRDINNAQMCSDGIEYFDILTSARVSNAVDTTGYNSVFFSLGVTGTTSYTIFFQGSNDNSTWANISFYSSTNGTWAGNIGGATGQHTGYLPVQTKYVRANITSGPSGANPIRVHLILRNAPLQVSNQTTVTNTPNVNLSTINTSAPANAAIMLPTGNGNVQALNGTLQFSGTQYATIPPPNSTTALMTNVPYPIGIGGIEKPYIGALSGVFRYFTLNSNGHVILGGENALTSAPYQGSLKESMAAGTRSGVGGVPNNIQGAQSLTVTDAAQDFGDTQVMLMRQILTELKILNQQFTELPNLLNQANYAVSDPQEYRNDGDFDSAIQ